VTTSSISASTRRWKRLRRLVFALLTFVFVVFNGIAFLHAWAITHYAPVETRTTRLREIHTWTDKARLLVLGPTIRRMANTKTPADFQLPYDSLAFPGARGARLAAWRVPGQPGRPTVLMFPGYAGSKDTLLRAAVEFHAAGCETWLIDFSGIGDSEGRTTTLGWREAEDVAATVSAARESVHTPLVLYGTSMGAVAILCASHRGLVAPDGVILECPFDRLSTTLGNRLQLLGVPPIPLAQGVAFWIGAQHGFNALAHNPVEYARSIRCPVLLMQGEKDQLVGQPAARAMAAAFGDKAAFEILPGSGHAYLVRDAASPWRSSVRRFLDEKLPGKLVHAEPGSGIDDSIEKSRSSPGL
jgi:alpha-beta hydrolase superfamily lysophospholipase